MKATCNICNIEYNRDIVSFEYPGLYVKNKFNISKNNIVPLLNIAIGLISFERTDLDYHEAIKLYAENDSLNYDIYVSLQNIPFFDNKNTSAETVLIHIIFDLFIRELKKCNGCIISMKKAIYSEGKIINNDDLEVRISRYYENLLKKEIKKIAKGTYDVCN